MLQSTPIQPSPTDNGKSHSEIPIVCVFYNQRDHHRQPHPMMLMLYRVSEGSRPSKERNPNSKEIWKFVESIRKNELARRVELHLAGVVEILSEMWGIMLI